jgi:hypothetical protein
MRQIMTRKETRKSIIRHFCIKLGLDINREAMAFCGLKLEAMSGRQIELMKEQILKRAAKQI